MLAGLIVWLGLVGVFCVVFGGDVARVPLNERCMIYNDVISVDHDHNQRTVSIHMKDSRNCGNPKFVLRLSGAALIKLSSQSRVEDVVVFSYPPLIDAGTYFLDVVVIFCHSFRPNSPHYNCVENVHYGRNILTKDYSFKSDSMHGIPAYPRWVRRPDATTSVARLPTRYQKLQAEHKNKTDCILAGILTYCAPQTRELEPYKEYHWTEPADWLPLIRQVHTGLTAALSVASSSQQASEQSLNGHRQLINVCFVGDSHSHALQTHLQRRITQNAEVGEVMASVYVLSLFAPQFSTSLFEQYNCSIAIISYGQWALTHSPVLHTQNMQESHMGALLDQITQGKTRVFLRSENYNGLGYPLIACPPITDPKHGPKDRRTPPAIDMMNNVTRTLSARAGVPFVDTSDVVGPMWDAGLEFSHPNEAVVEAQVNRILFSAFTHLLQHQWSVQTYSSNDLPLKDAVAEKPTHNELNALVEDMRQRMKSDVCKRDDIL